MFKISSHVRYSEVDYKGNMTVDAIVNYMQDVCMLQSEKVGLGVNQANEMPGIWFLASWQIEIVRVPKVYEEIDIFTYPYRFKGILGSRYFEIKNNSGEILVKANSIWSYLDIKTHVPRRIDQIQIDRYEPDDIVPDMEVLPRKIDLPQTEADQLAPLHVRIEQIDTNMHVNNCEYIRSFLEATGIADTPGIIRAEYKKSAVMGDVFYPYIYKEGNRTVGDLRDANGESYATVEFIF